MLGRLTVTILSCRKFLDLSGCGLRARAGHRRARAEGRRAGFFGPARFEPDFSIEEKIHLPLNNKFFYHSIPDIF